MLTTDRQLTYGTLRVSAKINPTLKVTHTVSKGTGPKVGCPQKDGQQQRCSENES